jgi:hypothetical protein
MFITTSIIVFWLWLKFNWFDLFFDLYDDVKGYGLRVRVKG